MKKLVFHHVNLTQNARQTSHVPPSMMLKEEEHATVAPFVASGAEAQTAIFDPVVVISRSISF